MRQWAIVFSKLATTQVNDVIDPFYRSAASVGGELAVAKHSQPLLETKLEPVATRDAISSPVVEILMCDNCFDTFKIAIGRSLRTGEYARRVENIEPLVFHRAHIEIINRDNVKNIKVVLAVIFYFIPAHRCLQSLHAKAAFVLISGTDPDV